MFKNCLLLSILFVACIHVSTKTEKTNSSIELYMRIQSVNLNNGEKVDFKDSIIIYREANYMIYKCPDLHVFTHSIEVKNTDVVEQTIVRQVVKYHYIIYNSKGISGYLYDSINMVKPRRINIDSFQRNTVMKGFPFYSANDSLISTVKTNSVLTEITLPKRKPDDTYPDSCYYSYDNKFSTAPFVFSGKLDSTRNLKLYKVLFIYNPVKKGKYPIDVPRREYLFELRKAQPAPEIPKLVERFKAMEAKLGL